VQWETKEQHILKCKISNENETVNTWNSYDQNHNNDLEEKVNKLMNMVKYFYFNIYLLFFFLIIKQFYLK